MQSVNPRIVVLGGSIPESLGAQLQGNIDLVPESEVEAGNWTGILVHARVESLSAVRRFRNAGGLTPIYGLADRAVDVGRRIQWIREGADDLLSLDTAAAVLTRRIRGPAAQVRPIGEPALPERVRIDRYLAALTRYLATRTELLEMLGEAGRQRFLDCYFLREQVLRAADGEFPEVGGQRRGADREPMQWGVRLLGRPPEESIAELQNIGPDGIGLSLHRPLPPGEQIRIELDGYNTSAIVTAEVRWQRRASRERWDVGTFALGLEITRSPAS